MVRIVMVPAACLALTGAAAAAAPPFEAGPVLARAAAGAEAPERPRLRGVEPETTASIPAPSARGPCPAARRVGTGAGFCLIN